MIPKGKTIVEETEENRQICRKYCTICPSYKTHHYDRYQPTELFCAHGQSSCPEKKEVRCYCVGCEIFARYHLGVGYFCSKG